MWWIVGAVAVIAVIAAALFYKRRKKEKEMPQGIQIFNSSGDLVFDMTKNTTYVLGTGQTGTANGSLSNSAIVSGRTWIIVITAQENALIPNFTVSSGKISWNFNTTSATSFGATIVNLSFLYGVY